MPTLSAETETDFLDVYKQTMAGLLPRDRVALNHALRSVTAAFAVVKTKDANPEDGIYPDLPDLPSSHVAAIAQSIADIEAGHIRSGAEVMAEMRERFGLGGKTKSE